MCTTVEQGPSVVSLEGEDRGDISKERISFG